MTAAAGVAVVCPEAVAASMAAVVDSASAASSADLLHSDASTFVPSAVYLDVCGVVGAANDGVVRCRVAVDNPSVLSAIPPGTAPLALTCAVVGNAVMEGMVQKRVAAAADHCAVLSELRMPLFLPPAMPMMQMS